MPEALTDLNVRLSSALSRATSQLFRERNSKGFWPGELSSSALSTATAVTALALAQQARADRSFSQQVNAGLDWLATHQNADGGWGDTTHSLSNISTTTLCWAAFGAVPGADEKYNRTVHAARCWLEKQARPHGELFSEALVSAIVGRYGKDRTFSVPILTTCALSGRLGCGPEAWRPVLQLPFELAAFPRRWFATLRLPVVSYALPALIAIGQARHIHLPSANPLARMMRTALRKRTLRVLEDIQPHNGGFLEATPLTSFVAMSLASIGLVSHPVTTRALAFLIASQKNDGSWPIDTNLATWVTTLSVNALGPDAFQPEENKTLRSWLLGQQYRTTHAYTLAAPGGWAWTDLPGGVPDADDTAGALLALRTLSGNAPSPEDIEVALRGTEWLLNLQNGDGGMPTFCRGWGALPFDRSAPDLTAHALRAWNAWHSSFDQGLQQRCRRAMKRAINYLKANQRADGAWVPLWFGNQFAENEENPLYGTSRVLLALSAFQENEAARFMACRASQWIRAAQKSDGGWGGEARCASTTEETALAVEALAALATSQKPQCKENETAVANGARWLSSKVESGEWMPPAPIGLYFARLWYFEKLYPQIFTVAAMRRARVLAAAG